MKARQYDQWDKARKVGRSKYAITTGLALGLAGAAGYVGAQYFMDGTPTFGSGWLAEFGIMAAIMGLTGWVLSYTWMWPRNEKKFAQETDRRNSPQG